MTENGEKQNEFTVVIKARWWVVVYVILVKSFEWVLKSVFRMTFEIDKEKFHKTIRRGVYTIP